MKVAILAPTSWLQHYSALSRYHLTLLHLYRIPGYRNFYVTLTEQGDWVILDNGANEGVTVDDEELMTAAIRFNVSEVVAPDQPRDGEESTERTLKFLSQRRDRLHAHDIRVLAIPQGKSIRHWVHNFHLIRPYTDSIGISKIVEEFTPRLVLAQFVNEWGIPIHLMGADRLFSDITQYRGLRNVRGVDTQKMVAAAAHRVLVGPNTTKKEFDSIDLGSAPLADLDKDAHEFALTNIQRYRKWANDD